MMVKFSRRFSFVTAIALLTLGAIDLPQTHAASLYLGLSQYVENIWMNIDIDIDEDALLAPLPVTRRNIQEHSQLSTTETIDRDIANRYKDLVEDNGDSIGLIESQKILKEAGLLEDNNQNTQKKVDGSFEENTFWVGETDEESKADQQIPKSILYSLILLFGLWSIPTLKYVSATFIFGETASLASAASLTKLATSPLVFANTPS